MTLPDPVRSFARWLVGRSLSIVFLIVAVGLAVGSRGRPLYLLAGLGSFLLAFRYYAWAVTRGESTAE